MYVTCLKPLGGFLHIWSIINHHSVCQPHHLFPWIRPGRDGRREERRDDRGRFDDRRGERPGVASLWCGKRGQFMWWSIQFHWQSRMKFHFILKVEFTFPCMKINCLKVKVRRNLMAAPFENLSCYMSGGRPGDRRDPARRGPTGRFQARHGGSDWQIGRKFRWNSRHEGILCLNERMNDFDAASRIPKNTSASGDLDTLMIFDPTFCNVTVCWGAVQMPDRRAPGYDTKKSSWYGQEHAVQAKTLDGGFLLEVSFLFSLLHRLQRYFLTQTCIAVSCSALAGNERPDRRGYQGFGPRERRWRRVDLGPDKSLLQISRFPTSLLC